MKPYVVVLIIRNLISKYMYIRNFLNHIFLEYKIYIYKTILEQIRYDNKKLTL